MMLVKTGPAGGLTTEPTGTFGAAFAQLNVVDNDQDVTLPGAFPKGVSVPVSAWGHGSWNPGSQFLPVGRATIDESGNWATAKGSIFMKTLAGRDTFYALEGLGELAEWSYGYTIKDSSYERVHGAPVRVLRAVDVYEISPVLKGAGVGTHTTELALGPLGRDAEQLALARLDQSNRRLLAGFARPKTALQVAAQHEYDRFQRVGGVGRATPMHRTKVDHAEVVAILARANGVELR